MRRRAGIVLALLLVLTGCTPAEPAGPAAEPAAEPVYMALTFDDGPSPSGRRATRSAITPSATGT